MKPSVCRYATAAAWSWHCQQSITCCNVRLNEILIRVHTRTHCIKEGFQGYLVHVTQPLSVFCMHASFITIILVLISLSLMLLISPM